MDNASIHPVDALTDVLNMVSVRHKVVFSPPYKPHLNPIEYMFKKMKGIIVYTSRNSTEHLNTLIQKAIEEVDKTDWNG